MVANMPIRYTRGNGTVDYTGNVDNRNDPSMSFIETYSDKPPISEELGSSYDWDVVIGGYEDGIVYQKDLTIQRDFQQMLDTDGKAQSVENLLVYPIISAPREIVGTKGDTGQADKIKELLSDAPYEEGMRIPIDIVILQMTGAMTFKKTFFEKVFKVRDKDGLVGYDKIAWRAPETCELALDAETGEYRGFRQSRIHYEWQKTLPNDFGYVNMNLDRAFVYIYGSWRDPIQGISAMQVPFWCFQTKRRLMYLWYQYLEQTSLPKTVVSNADEKKAVQDARRVATLKSRGVLGKTDETTLTTLESSGLGATQFVEAIRYLDSEMSQSVLGGFLDLTSMSSAGKGSFALSEDQSKLFLRTRRVVAYDMARQFNEQVIAPLCHYNFGRTAPCPKLIFGPMSEANEQLVMDTFNGLVTAASNTSSTGGVAVTDEFFNELSTRTATILELDPEKVAAAIKTEGSPLDRLRKAAAVATQAMHANMAQQNTPNNNNGNTASKVLDDAKGKPVSAIKGA